MRILFSQDARLRQSLRRTCFVMPLVAAAVLPHGDFAFDPSLLSNPTSRAAADGLHRGSLLAGRLLADAAPDAIVLTTPHGLQTSWDVGIYQNAALQGVATVGRDLQESTPTAMVSPTASILTQTATASTMPRRARRL